MKDGNFCKTAPQLDIGNNKQKSTLIKSTQFSQKISKSKRSCFYKFSIVVYEKNMIIPKLIVIQIRVEKTT